MIATLVRTKRAEPVGSSDRSFETALANMAFSTVRDRAPGLLDHLVGFQLLDKSDDSTNASGIFGFQLGDQWLYSPIFFRNGDLRGSELLYLKNQDLFVPMKENWINYVLNRRTPILGKGVNRNSRLLGVLQPNLSSVGRPSGLKYGSAFPDWVLSGLPGLARARQTMKYDGIDLPAFLKLAGRPAVRMLLGWCRDYPKLAEAVDKLHGLKALFGATTKAAQEGVGSPSSFMARIHDVADEIGARVGISGEFLRGYERAINDVVPSSVLGGAGIGATAVGVPWAISSWLRRRKEKQKRDEETKTAGDVQFITRDAARRSALTFSDEDTQALLRDGYLVRDKRAADSVSRVYAVPVNIREKACLTNPTVTGIFDVLVRPGDFEEMLVVVHPYAENTRKHMATVVRLDGEKNWINADLSNVWIYPDPGPAEDTKWFDRLPRSAAPAVGGIYVAITAAGQGTAPFEIRADLGKFEGRHSYGISFRDYLAGPVPRFRRRAEYDGASYPDYSDGCRLHIRTKPGTKIRQFGSDLFLPAGARLVHIYTPPKSYSDAPSAISDESRGKDPAPILLGNWMDVRRAIYAKTAALSLSQDGTSVNLNGRLFGPLEAVSALVAEHGLRAKTARSVLELVERNRRIQLRVKYAAPYPLQLTAPSAPAIQDPIYGGTADTAGTAQLQVSSPQRYPIDGMQGAYTDPSVYDAMLPPLHSSQMVNPGPSRDTMQAAMAASQRGQREIFDTAVIGGLLRSGRPEAMVRDHSGDIMNAMNKLGRLYFSSLHRPDAWEDLYGKADAGEVRDAILNSFESLGDVVLYLKEHQIGEINERLNPNIEQVAEEE